jgi:hypothetical protein
MTSNVHGIFFISNYLVNDEDFEESESAGGWISWFCELEGHDFFAEVFDVLN